VGAGKAEEVWGEAERAAAEGGTMMAGSTFNPNDLDDGIYDAIVLLRTAG
jgi:hypothetical protein